MDSVRHMTKNGKMCEQVDMNVFARYYPSTVVNEILAAHLLQANPAGKQPKSRIRHCTPECMVLFLLCCSMWRRLSQKHVWQQLMDGLGDLFPNESFASMTASALSQQRAKWGSEPLQKLQQHCCQPLCHAETPNAFYQDMRIMAIDGSLFNVPDTSANERAFGRSRNQHGKGAYPQARAVLLMECGSHAIVDAALGGYNWAETHGVVKVLNSITSAMLVLGDCGIFSGYLAETCRRKDAHVLCALASHMMTAVKERLSDGSYLTVLKPSRTSKYRPKEKQTLRVIEYQLTDERCGVPGRVYRLVTSLLDEKRYPAEELIELYLQRWDVELMIRELKMTLHEQVKVLRSKTPDGVKQELYGLFLAHYGIRAWMAEAGKRVELDPRQLSCINAFQHIRRRVERVVTQPRCQREHILTRMVQLISQDTLPPPQMRSNRREIKQVYNKHKPKKRGKPAPAAFEKTDRYLMFVAIVHRPMREQTEVKKKPPAPKVDPVVA